MAMPEETLKERPSLEALVESGLLKLQSLHPGGLALTRELAELCDIRKGASVLDVASGTGESACFLAEEIGARVHGIDHSERMLRQAREKARARGLDLDFSQGDAAQLPFRDAEFDAVICECTLCFLQKSEVIREMLRVVRSGGHVGMHDLCWEEDTPDRLKRTLSEIEGERPETLEKWRRLFATAGLVRIRSVNKSEVMSRWMRESRKQLGVTGHLALFRKILPRWGFSGLWKILRSERVFSSRFLGYGIVEGTKP